MEEGKFRTVNGVFFETRTEKNWNLEGAVLDQESAFFKGQPAVCCPESLYSEGISVANRKGF